MPVKWNQRRCCECTYRKERGRGRDLSLKDVRTGIEQAMNGTHKPDSAMIARNSFAMYRAGLPTGGVSRSCTLDFTTSVVMFEMPNGLESGRMTNLTDTKKASTLADKCEIKKQISIKIPLTPPAAPLVSIAHTGTFSFPYFWANFRLENSNAVDTSVSCYASSWSTRAYQCRTCILSR
jgi:hypothetical protein